MSATQPTALRGATPSLLRLKRGEERRLAAGHLWVFSNEVDTAATPLTAFSPGGHAELRSARDAFMGHAYVNPHALICARILSRRAERPIDATLIEERLAAALELRRRLGAPDFCRWVFGESDLLPGLVLDRYGSVVVGQSATAGMEALLPVVAEAVQCLVNPTTLLWKNDTAARELEGLPRETQLAFGPLPESLTVREGTLTFEVPLGAAQKTGWFYDQAANRAHLARYLPAGSRVLDVCCYAGAWGVSALRHGAASALCVDAAQAALECASANAARNGLGIDTLRADAFEALQQLGARGERFDVVVLDPPAFIKRRKDAPQGQAAYRKLNQLALAVLKEGGLLVSCSCSYHLAPEELLAAIQGAARQAGRFVQVLETGGQSPDHPLHPAIPETRYLKAFFCRVTGAVG